MKQQRRFFVFLIVIGVLFILYSPIKRWVSVIDQEQRHGPAHKGITLQADEVDDLVLGPDMLVRIVFDSTTSVVTTGWIDFETYRPRFEITSTKGHITILPDGRRILVFPSSASARNDIGIQPRVRIQNREPGNVVTIRTRHQ